MKENRRLIVASRARFRAYVQKSRRQQAALDAGLAKLVRKIAQLKKQGGAPSARLRKTQKRTDTGLSEAVPR